MRRGDASDGMPQFRRTIHSTEQVRALLERNELADLDAIFHRGLAMPRRRDDRVVYPVTLTDEAGQELPAFIKLNWGYRRLLPRVKDVRARQMFKSLPAREWNGLQRFRGIGVNVPEPLALLEDGTFRFRAAIVIRAIPVAESLAERLLRKEWQTLPAQVQHAHLNKAVATLDFIHASGFRWRGASTRHLFFESDTSENPKLWLIDCEGTQPCATQRDIVRDFQKLLHSFRETGADKETLARLQQEVDLRARSKTRKAA